MLGANRPRRQRGGQCLRQRVHAIGQRHEQAVTRARRLLLEMPRPSLARLAAQAPDHAAVLALHRGKLRKRRVQAQVVGIGRVDPRDQRLHQAVERLAAEPAAHERPQALLRFVAPPRNHQIHQQPQLAAKRKDRRRQDRQQPVRRHQHKAFRHRRQPAVAHHERPPFARVGLDQLIGQPQPRAEIKPPRLVGDERVRTALEREAVESIGPDHASDAVLGFEHRPARPAGAASARAREPGARPSSPTARRRSRSRGAASFRRPHVQPKSFLPALARG